MPLNAPSGRDVAVSPSWPEQKSLRLAGLAAHCNNSSKSRYGELDESAPATSPTVSSDGCDVPSSSSSTSPPPLSFLSHARCRSVSSTYAESLTYSASTLSSRPSTPGGPGGGAFASSSPRGSGGGGGVGSGLEPWISSLSPRFPGDDHHHYYHLPHLLYSPSHSRNPSMDSQLHGGMAAAAYTHRPKSPPRRPSTYLERASSFDLPLRLRFFEPKSSQPKVPLLEDDEEAGEEKESERRRPCGAASVRHEDKRPLTADSQASPSLPLFGRCRRKLSNFLMSPPPRKARKSRVVDEMPSPIGTVESPMSVTSPHAGAIAVVDLDEVDPMIRQLCCNILMDLYGIDALEASVPLKVWDAVVRCLDDVSVAVDKDSAGRSDKSAGGHTEYAAATGSGNSAASTPGQMSGSGDSTSRKRNSRQAGYGDGDGGSGDGTAEDERGDEDAVREDAQRKKPKVETEQAAFSCPFRKRNPLRFNIRDHEHCCRKPIIGIPELKRHIRTYHRREAPSLYQCRRCKRGFPSEDALDAHSILPTDMMCKPSSRPLSDDPEDGITEEMDKILAGRKANSKVQCWDQIWALIFPDVNIISSVFEPVIEHFEVKCELNRGMADLRSAIQDDLRQYLSEQGNHILFSLQKSIETAVEIYTATALRNCRNRVNAQSATASSTATTTTERRQSRQSGAASRRSTARHHPTTNASGSAALAPQPTGTTGTFRSIAPKPSRSGTVSSKTTTPQSSDTSPEQICMTTSPAAASSSSSGEQQQAVALPPPPPPPAIFMPSDLPLRHFQANFANANTCSNNNNSNVKPEDSTNRDSGIVMGCTVCFDESGHCGCYDDDGTSPILDFSMFANPDETTMTAQQQQQQHRQDDSDASVPFDSACGPMSVSPCDNEELAMGEPGEVMTHSFHQAQDLGFSFMPGYDSFYNDETSI